MHPQKRTLGWIVLLGGVAVLASYAYILGLEPEIQVKLWGGVPAALWLPLTAAMVQQSNDLLWLAVRLILLVVGLGAVMLLVAPLGLRPRRPAKAYWFAVAGGAAFCLQTSVLDLFVWTALFPI